MLLKDQLRNALTKQVLCTHKNTIGIIIDVVTCTFRIHTIIIILTCLK